MAHRHLFRIFSRTITTSLCVAPFLSVKCQVPKEEDTKYILSNLSAEKVSFEYMVKQSALDSVNNASKLLTITYTAVEINSKEYRELLLQLISLTRETFMFDVGDEHWDLILNTRSELQDKKKMILELTQNMDYIHKLATATTEICYSAGLENLSHTLNERVDDALNKIKAQLQMNTELEAEYIDMQRQIIDKNKRSAEDIEHRKEKSTILK